MREGIQKKKKKALPLKKGKKKEKEI